MLIGLSASTLVLLVLRAFFSELVGDDAKRECKEESLWLQSTVKVSIVCYLHPGLECL